MSVQSDQLKERTIVFAVSTLRLIDAFPHTVAARVIAHQLAKSATSVGANYRAVCSARSKAEFIARLQIVVGEAEESVYRLDVIDRSQIVPHSVHGHRSEANELLSIFSSSLRTARSNLQHHSHSQTPKSQNPNSQSPDPNLPIHQSNQSMTR